MLKKLALAAPAVVLSAGLTFAQGAPANQAPSGAPSAQSSSLSAPEWLASDIYKADVYDKSEQKLGDVADLVIKKSDGTVSQAVIGMGGFLGIGEKQVAVPFKDLKVSSAQGKDWLTLKQTKDQLAAAPEFKPEEQTGRSAAPPAAPPGEWLMSNLYKADVYYNSEHKLGKITNLLIDPSSGKIADMSVTLADSNKEASVPLSSLRIDTRNGKNWLVIGESKDQLMNAPAFQKPENKKM